MNPMIEKTPVSPVNGSKYDNMESADVIIAHPGESHLITDNLQSTSWDAPMVQKIVKRTSIVGYCLVFIGIFLLIVGCLTFSRDLYPGYIIEGCLVGILSIISGTVAISVILRSIRMRLSDRATLIRFTAAMILLGIADFVVGFCDCFFVIFKLLTASDKIMKSDGKPTVEPYSPRSDVMFLALAISHMFLIVLLMISGFFLIFSSVRLRHVTLEKNKQSEIPEDYFD